MPEHFRTAWIVIPSLVLCLFGAAAASAEIMKAPAEPLQVSVPEGVEKFRQGPVLFEHAKHQGEACTVCHHTWDGIAPIAACSSSGCHDLANPSREQKSDPAYFRNAHHVSRGSEAMNSCNACHGSLKKKGEPAGPTKCKGCHQKKSAWEN